ncbi:MAG TPA: SRPBCC domain-containing protein [Acidimicrobiia bacterium]|nr:SRPBCC domain-containing protein [Acidimicrobiia bacterium]
MEPIIVEFEVDATPAHAFDVWISRPTMWWPRSHTVTQDPDLIVVFEPFEGGRIYERGSDGSEHEWGEILVWEPPSRVGYLWHLFFDRSEATVITVTFTGTGTGSRVKLVQTGFEKLGDEVGPDRQARTNQAWLEVTGRYRSALTGSGP